MGKQKWRRIGIQIAAFLAEECKNQGITVPSFVNEETPCVLMQLTNPSDARPTSLPLIMCDEFLGYADRTSRPNNRCSVWVFMQVHDGIIQNFTHFTLPRRKAKKARGELLNRLFGVSFREGKRPSGGNTGVEDDLFKTARTSARDEAMPAENKF
jgi:hypothetical protein